MATNNWQSLKQSLKNIKTPADARKQFFAARQQVLADPDIQHFLKTHPELNEAAVNVGLSKLREYLTTRDNPQSQGVAGYVAELDVVNGQIVVNYHVGNQLQAQRDAYATSQRLKMLYLPQGLKQATMTNFDQGDQQRMAAYIACAQFLNDCAENPNDYHRGLYLTGNFGVGKTYLLAAVANSLADEGITACLVHVPTFLAEVKAALRTRKPNDTIQQLKDVAVLMLDDIGATTMSSWERDDILGIILQSRMQAEKTTFFSSNFTQEQLKQMLEEDSQGNIDKVKANRIMERIYALSKEVVVMGNNRRH